MRLLDRGGVALLICMQENKGTHLQSPAPSCLYMVVKHDLKESFGIVSLLRILGYHWFNFVSNKRVLGESWIRDITCIIKNSRYDTGHLVRFP